MMVEMKKGSTFARVVVASESDAKIKARAMAKRWGTPVTVFTLRGRDNRKKFLCKIKG